jgi:hypothetical protein
MVRLGYFARLNFEATKDEKEHILKNYNPWIIVFFSVFTQVYGKWKNVYSVVTNIIPNAVISRNIKKTMGLFRPAVWPFCLFNLKLQNQKHFSLMNCFLSVATIFTSWCHVSYFLNLIHSPLSKQCRPTSYYRIHMACVHQCFRESLARHPWC